MTVDPVSIRDTDTLLVAARTLRDLGRSSVRGVRRGSPPHRRPHRPRHRGRLRGRGGRPGTTTAGEVTAGVPVTVEADDCIERALQLMATTRVRRVPVVDQGRLVGDLHEAAVVVAMPAVAVKLVRRPGA